MSTTFEDIEKAPPKIDWNWCRDFLAYPGGPGANGRYGKDIIKPSEEPVELMIIQDIKPPEPEPPKKPHLSHLKL